VQDRQTEEGSYLIKIVIEERQVFIIEWWLSEWWREGVKDEKKYME
jgi:hypothetical protein